jgi:hypothetical protein
MSVLSGFGFCVLSEAADEDDFVEHGVWLRCAGKNRRGVVNERVIR